MAPISCATQVAGPRCPASPRRSAFGGLNIDGDGPIDHPVRALDGKKRYYWVLAGAFIFGLQLKHMLCPAKLR